MFSLFLLFCCFGFFVTDFTPRCLLRPSSSICYTYPRQKIVELYSRFLEEWDQLNNYRTCYRLPFSSRIFRNAKLMKIRFHHQTCATKEFRLWQRNTTRNSFIIFSNPPPPPNIPKIEQNTTSKFFFCFFCVCFDWPRSLLRTVHTTGRVLRFKHNQQTAPPADHNSFF